MAPVAAPAGRPVRSGRARPGALVVHGWARWSLRRFLGYEVIPQLGREVRLEPGFGLANVVGATALAFALVLAATPSDRALRGLGAPAWRWLHHGARFDFYLTLLHVGYFLFLHYTLSFHKTVPPPDWFHVPFVLTGISLIGLQVAAFIKDGEQAERSGGAGVRRHLCQLSSPALPWRTGLPAASQACMPPSSCATSV